MPLNKIPRLRDPENRDFVLEVRNLVMEQCRREPDLYYPEDLTKVENIKFLIQRCIIYKKKDVRESASMLINMLKWRKEQRLMQLTDADFPVEYHMTGTAFSYEHDKFGNRTLYIRSQMLRSIPEMKTSFKQFLTYLVYQIDDDLEGTSWAIIFDLTNTGWNNFYIDLLVHLISLLKEYFPMSLDYVLAINFPWILTAAWSIVKRLIPPERRDAVIFINQEEIFNYVDMENVPDFLGGTCQREHKLAPKTCPMAVDCLMELEDPVLTKKRIREIIKTFSDILPKDHVERSVHLLEERCTK